ncbi:MAG: radical SAM/SPASM domain-containing protein [Pseudomonadota bacterium]
MIGAADPLALTNSAFGNTLEHVQVQTASWCNRTCAFCPSGTFDIPKTFMADEVLDRLSSELRRLGFAGRFSPYLMNEPLLDKRLHERLSRVRSVLDKATFFISTNADALSLELGLSLFDAGLDRMLVNLYDADGAARDRAVGVISALAKAKPDLRIVKDTAFPELVDTPDITGEKLIAVSDASSWKVDELTNRAGNVVDAAVPAEPLKASCYRPFRQVYVRYTGDVVLCCCDWRGEVVFGNVMEADLDVILGGRLANTYRDHLRRKDRNLPLCRSCDFDGLL